MASENLIRKRITKEMPPDALKKHIVEFLKTQNMCVLATCISNSPRATPIEYYSKGMTLYMIAEEGKKLENIRANPQVSIGIFAPYNGWMSVRGVQITGMARIVSRKEKAEYNDWLSVYKWQRSAQELGIKTLPENVKAIRVDVLKVELTDISLKENGYAARQVLVKRN
jgi:nitroimidazol reductase NimA-like FMN-containing flavoprotein (pyridoxamine 5'-phosphate oxidase superfamily)